MRDTTARTQKTLSNSTIEKLPFNRIPHQSRLFLEYLNNAFGLSGFYPSAVNQISDLAARAPAILESYTTDRARLANALLAANQFWQASPQTLKNIERLRAADSVAVVTGQQAGLFTGASYTIYKALSVVKAAEELRRNGVNAVPVFWIASEDHDFAEVAATFVLNRENVLTKIEIATVVQNENLPVGKIMLDDSIHKAIESLFAALPKTDFSAGLHDLIVETYQPNRSLSEAFARLMAKLFAEFGLILLDPLDEKLKRLAAPIYQKAVERSAEITAGLIEQNRRLADSNFHQQIKIEPNAFPFFWLNENGQRIALERDNNIIRAKKQNVRFEIAELLEIARNQPERLSPNATLRAVVQDFLLPTIGYFGGAAEVAYFAQTADVSTVLERPATAIFHRASVTIVEPNVHRTLDRYNLTLEDFFASPEELTAKIVNEFLNNETAAVFAETNAQFNAQLDKLKNSLTAIDRTLSDSLTRRKQKILWHLEVLQRKFYHSELRRNETAKNRLDTAFANLYPHSGLQERTLNIAFLLNRHGENILDWIYAAINADAKEHQVLYL